MCRSVLSHSIRERRSIRNLERIFVALAADDKVALLAGVDENLDIVSDLHADLTDVCFVDGLGWKQWVAVGALIILYLGYFALGAVLRAAVRAKELADLGFAALVAEEEAVI